MYEHTPMPSQPTNMLTTLSDITSTCINSVNSDSQLMNTPRCASPRMYHTLYTCTASDTPVTVHSRCAVNRSYTHTTDTCHDPSSTQPTPPNVNLLACIPTSPQTPTLLMTA